MTKRKKKKRTRKKASRKRGASSRSKRKTGKKRSRKKTRKTSKRRSSRTKAARLKKEREREKKRKQKERERKRRRKEKERLKKLKERERERKRKAREREKKKREKEREQKRKARERARLKKKKEKERERERKRKAREREKARRIREKEREKKKKEREKERERKKKERERLREEKRKEKERLKLKKKKERERIKKKKEEERKRKEENARDITRDQTPMRIYLNQIEKIPLLTPEEEVKLSKKIHSRTRGSSAAREKMIRSNLRLVINLAKRYTNLGLSFSDLVEEGNIGLMRAVEKFNYKRGYRFSTYASWWIKQSIMRALSNQGKVIRIPVYMIDIVSKWRKVRDALTQKFGRVPTRKEVAKAMKIPVKKLKGIEKIAIRPGSLNVPVSLDKTAELIDLIEDDSFVPPSESVDEVFKSERLQELLGCLDERERKILVLRFGIENGESRTLEEVAKEFGVTRERVRQIEATALKKLKYRARLEEDKPENYLT